MFQALIENSEDIVIVTDKDFKVRYISSSVHDIFRVKPPSVIGRDLFDFVHGEKAPVLREKLEQVSSVQSGEIVVMIAGEKVYFDVHVNNLLHEDEVKGVLVKLHNITEKKRREKELLRSNRHLDQVIYKTTHDLKAPLMSALGLVNIAERAPENEKGHYISMIKKSLLGMDSYIEEMNNFFRIDKLALQRERIQLSDILIDLRDNLSNFLNGDKIQVHIQLDEETAWYSDSLRVKTIISNIFSNAIKYQDFRKSNPFIKIVTRISEDFCDISIEDNGIGIKTEFHEKIFDLFFRGTDQSQGTGLGLFIVKDTIERLKGRIEVTSTVGKGTTFFVRIPNQLHQPMAVA